MATRPCLINQRVARQREEDISAYLPSSSRLLPPPPPLTSSPELRATRAAERHRRKISSSPSTRWTFLNRSTQRHSRPITTSSPIQNTGRNCLDSSSMRTLCCGEPQADVFVIFRSEFINDSDAIRAFEDYLRASKGSLTPNEIAKIRDHTGVVGMAGT